MEDEGPHTYHTYEMVDNPSYTRERKSYRPREEAVVESSTRTAAKLASANNSNLSSAKDTSKVNKFTIAAVITVCLVIVLAVSSIAVAVVAYFNMKALRSEEAQQITPEIVMEMQAQITKLSQDLEVTQSQLSEITMDTISSVQVIPGPPGIEGPPGVPGGFGLSGPAGPPGQKGDTGLRGIQGPTGRTGDIGPRGIDGDPGFDGAPGDQGVAGAPGVFGIPGIEGQKGQKGSPPLPTGVPGPPG